LKLDLRQYAMFSPPVSISLTTSTLSPPVIWSKLHHSYSEGIHEQMNTQSWLTSFAYSFCP